MQSAREAATRLLSSPLRPIADKLLQLIDEAQCAFEVGSLSARKLGELCRYILHLISQLPQSFGERFFLDSAIIRGIATDWGTNVLLSPMVVPRYEHPWAHGTIALPSEDRDRTHVINLIYMPGRDRLEEVALLEYPWMVHELGHYLVFRDDSRFTSVFVPVLQDRIRSLRLASIADRGAARIRAQSTVDDIAKVWTPTPDHANWAHELAIDLISWLPSQQCQGSGSPAQQW